MHHQRTPNNTGDPIMIEMLGYLCGQLNVVVRHVEMGQVKSVR